MKIYKMLLLLDNEITRKYEWDEDHLTMEELLAFMASRGKFPQGTTFQSSTDSR